VQDFPRRRHHFRADAVACDHHHGGHARFPSLVPMSSG
jgi:hypothetical protein